MVLDILSIISLIVIVICYTIEVCRCNKYRRRVLELEIALRIEGLLLEIGEDKDETEV